MLDHPTDGRQCPRRQRFLPRLRYPPAVVPSPRDLLLFLHAFRLAGHAQAVRRRPLPVLAASLPRLRGLPRGLDPDAALAATLRAVSRGERWFGWLGTCLEKALVLSTLLSDRDAVEVVLGFRPPEGSAALDGHAWIRVGSREISLLGPREAADEGYVRLHALPVRRPDR